jgi:hypothetical protein
MSVTLKLNHEDGIRLRQQAATKVERVQTEVDGHKVDTPIVSKGVDWRFEREDVQQDEDPRKVDTNGRKIKLGTYTVYITAGLKNLVVERKGPVKPYNFHNNSIRNQIRIQPQKLTEVKKGKEGEKPVMGWKNDGTPTYVPANTFGGVFVGDNLRAVIDEMPT